MKTTIEFESGDFDTLHDIIFGLTDNKLSHDELEVIFKELPEDLQSEAIHWGLSDSVVRDNMYEYLEKKFKNERT